MKLSEAKQGVFEISKIEAPENVHVLRLCEMGMIPGARVTLLKEGRRGSPLLIKVNNTVICLEEMLASCFLLVKQGDQA